MASKQDTMIDIGWIFVPLPGKSLIFEGLRFRRGEGGLRCATDLLTDLNFLLALLIVKQLCFP